ncbi:hypothetical protein DFH09DRAFT_1431435 [Mycena vulgaris]|nr:hypothetical protein DFH09DRAFT_1431435 [Mycena vulgaris]
MSYNRLSRTTINSKTQGHVPSVAGQVGAYASTNSPVEPINAGSRPGVYGGIGGDGGNANGGKGHAAEGGVGEGTEFTIIALNGILPTADVYGGKGGKGGDGESAAKGGVGCAPKIVQSLQPSIKTENLPHLALAQFCTQYKLSHKILDLLHEAGFETAASLCEVTEKTLKEANFKVGQIAELKRALKQFSLNNGVPIMST